MSSNRNPDVPGNPDRRDPLPLSAEGETVDANPPTDEPVGPMPNGPDPEPEEDSDGEEPERDDSE